MSDQALVWKAGFGALVLLFCAVTYVARKPVEANAPAAKMPAASPLQALPALPQASDPAPLDVQEDAPPVRVEVTLNDPEPQRARAASKLLSPAPKARVGRAAPPRIHPVVARRKASPYAIGRKHYPYDPKQRWAFREAP